MSSQWRRTISIFIASASAYRVSRPQAELRPEGPKIKAPGQYYGKDQAYKERSDLSACLYSYRVGLKNLRTVWLISSISGLALIPGTGIS